MNVSRLGPNALRIDYLDLEAGGKVWKGVYYYGSAQEFGEVADWRGLQHFALPGIFDTGHQPLDSVSGHQGCPAPASWRAHNQ